MADQEEAMRLYASKLKMRALLGIALSAMVISCVLGFAVMVLLLRESPKASNDLAVQPSAEASSASKSSVVAYPVWLHAAQQPASFPHGPSLEYSAEQRHDHVGRPRANTWPLDLGSVGGIYNSRQQSNRDSLTPIQVDDHHHQGARNPHRGNWPPLSRRVSPSRDTVALENEVSNVGGPVKMPTSTTMKPPAIHHNGSTSFQPPRQPPPPPEQKSQTQPQSATPDDDQERTAAAAATTLTISHGQPDVTDRRTPESFAEYIHLRTTQQLTDTHLREVYERNSSDERSLNVARYVEDRLCTPKLECHPLWDSYQSFDGTCNNQENKAWGKANSCLRRILPAHYADGVSAPRANSASPTTVSMALQKARRISSLTSSPKKAPARNLNLLLMAFMQLVAHDLSSTVSSELKEGGTCCSQRTMLDDACTLAIDTSNDPFYADKGINCTNFVRSARCPCSRGTIREQLNSATAYLDLGPVYGRTHEESLELRDTNRTYLLATSESGLPPTDGDDYCRHPGRCFRGDSKISQQHALSVMHVAFLRYHNRLAQDLRLANPPWSDDIVFFEARRMVIFHYQVIIFRELLPALLGEETCRCLGIHFDDLVNGTTYDSANEAGVYNEFSTAVFRAHTLIPSTFGSIDIKFFDTDDFKNTTYMATLLEELFKTPTSRGFPATELAVHHALDEQSTSYGLNMIAINVQRGRDHGLPPYIRYVEKRAQLNVSKWIDLVRHNILPVDSVKILRKIYARVEDIDLFVGKDLETKPLPGVLGLTFEEIVARQFREVALRDRFFFSHRQPDWSDGSVASWKANIDKAWMSFVLCTAFPREVTVLPKNTMFQLDDDNFATCDTEKGRWLGLGDVDEDDR